METKYGYMKSPILMPVDGTKVMAYARITWDIDGLGKTECVSELVICKRIHTPFGTWRDDVVHDRSGRVLHCEVLGWFNLPFQ